MAKPLSDDIRKRIVEAVKAGMSRQAAGAKFEVAPSSAVKIVHLWKTTGSWAPKRFGGHKQPVLMPYKTEVEALIAERPAITLCELQSVLAEQSISVSIAAIDRFLKAVGLRYKKNTSCQRTRQTGRKGGA